MNKRITIDHQPSTINNLLIANRGEIASRIIRTCRKMGIKSIAVFAEADRHAAFVEEADMAVYIGESSPVASYLNQDKIIETAKKTGAAAIHPGYGFLSENANFARRCAEEGIVFIGPNPDAIEAMGSKSKAKTLMQANGVPVLPGYLGADQREATLTEAALELGFPILLKATAGGGGKGMRIVHEAKEMAAAIQAAKREALSAFGADELMVEKYIAAGRHIEFQVFGDKHGNAIHVLERECSIQRRYQKVIEESPSPVMDETLRNRMGAAAVKAAKALHYDNAGTVEFMYDQQSGAFYFLEVNTRLQVEHPVTEAITGLDLVQMQIESAMGLPLAISQEEVKGKGYAIEARLYAEDAANGFLPVTGKIHFFELPQVEGLRVETGIRSGSEVSIYYDPMIAKIIVWDERRAGAHRKLQYVLSHLICLGMTTNQDFLRLLLQHPDLLAGDYDTHFISNKIALATLASHKVERPVHAAIAATLLGWHQRESARTLLRAMPSGWRNNFNDFQQECFLEGDSEIMLQYRYQNEGFVFKHDETRYAVQLIGVKNHQLRAEIDGIQYLFNLIQDGHTYYLHNENYGSITLLQKDRFPVQNSTKIEGGYAAPMPSQIIKVLVSEGQEVSAGDPLIILSSMKMENTIEAIADGRVEEIFAVEGDNVAAGFLLLKIS
ncbi:MAG: biotin carboxylase N-terminal domain-containing protein [Saprospiraceae bacterium]